MTTRPTIRRARWCALAALALAALVAACGSDPKTVVVVTLRGRVGVRPFTTLDITVSNAGGSVGQTFSVGAGDKLPLTFSVTPTGRTGILNIQATAKQADGLAAARGSVDVAIVTDQRVDAELTLLPDDFVVNKAIVDSQFLVFDQDQAGRQIAVAPDGSFITTFENNCPLARCDVLARRFAASTAPAVNGTTSDDGDLIVNQVPQYGESPTIAASASGYFVAWLSRPDNSIGPRDLRATVLGLDGGHAQGSDIDVSLDPEDDLSPSVFARTDGSFVVVWSRQRPAPATTQEVRARIYGADGNPRNNGVTGTPDDFLVSAVAGEDEIQPHGAALADGGFVIVWVANTSNVRGRVFDGAAAAVGPAQTITTYSGATVYSPRVATSAEGFVAGWQVAAGAPPELASRPLMVRRFSKTGAQLSTEISAALVTTFFQAAPALAVRASDGAIGVTWPECGDLGDPDKSCGIRFRLLRKSGQPVGDSLLVDTTSTGDQRAPTIQAAPDDGFLIGWTDESMKPPDDRGSSVRARVIYPSLDRHDGVLGAHCDGSSDAACANGLTCQPDADGNPLCHATCTAACPGGGVCLNGTYCAFQ